MPTNSRRKLKRLKTQASETMTAMREIMALLAEAGLPANTPSDAVLAVQGMIARRVRGGPSPGSRGIPASLPASRPKTAPLALSPPSEEFESEEEEEDQDAPPMEEMERLYREKLGRTMEQAQGYHVDPRTGQRTQTRARSSPAGGQRAAHPLLEQQPEEWSEGEEEEEGFGDYSGRTGGGRANPETGLTVDAQRAVIESVTGRRVDRAPAGRPNPKFFGKL